MRKCKECGIDFEPVKTRGTEQLYCSKTCQSKAAQKRYQERLKHKIYEEAKKSHSETLETSVGAVEEPQRLSASYSSLQGSRDDNRAQRGSYSDNYSKDYLELYYEAKIDNNFYKLKNEALEKRVMELEREIFDLNSELDNLDEKSDEGGMLGNIIEQFKKDPVNSVKFASSIIENLTKSKS